MLTKFKPFIWSTLWVALLQLTTLHAQAYEPDRLEQLPNTPFVALDGQPISLEDTQGSYRVINFWATWCPPCVKEMPALSRLHEQLKSHNGQVIAINVGEQADQVEAFLLEQSLETNMGLWLDPQGRAFTEFKLGGLPLTYIIDREGQVLDLVLGVREWDSAETLNALLEAFKR